MSKKKNKKQRKRQVANRSKRRSSGSRKPHRSGAASSGLLKKSGDLYHIHSQAGLNVLLASGKPTLVDFWAPWCQPCLRMGPIFERIASKYGDQINFAKVDTQSLPKVGKRYGVQSIPTIIAFEGRQEAGRKVGLMNEPSMRRFAEDLIPEEEEEEEEIEEELPLENEVQGGEDSKSFEDGAGDADSSKVEKSSGGLTKRIRRLFGGGNK